MKTWSPKARYCASNWIMALEIWHFQASKCQKVILDVRYPWAEGLMTLEKSHFQDAKIRMSFSRHHIPLMRGSYDSPLIAFSGICNVKKDFHKKSWTLEATKISNMRSPGASIEPSVWGPMNKRIFGSAICQTAAPWKQDTLDPNFSDPWGIALSGGWNGESGSHESGYRCVGDFIKRQETHFQASNMMKSC